MDKAKGKILVVGHVIDGKPEDWQFDCEMKVPAIEVTADAYILYAGYSISELAKISRDYWGDDGQL